MSNISTILNNVSDYRKKTCLKLKDMGLPIVIFGAGLFAHGIARVLEKNGITNYTFSVDEKYITEKWKNEVLTPQQIDTKYPEYLLILGHAKGNTKAIPPQFHNAVAYKSLMGDDEFGIIDEQYLKANLFDFEQTYGWLSDELSRNSMLSFLDGKLNHNGEKLLPFVCSENYFFNDLFTFQPETVFIDCGAYDGDTVIEFVKRYQNYRQIICFEPDKRNFDSLQKRTNTLRNITMIQKGNSNKNSRVTFCESSDNALQSKVSETGGSYIEVVKIDDCVKDEHKVGMIKMDIEDSKLAALQGAERIIVRDNPILAICVYHKSEDMITIPQYIKSLNPDYRLFLRYNEEAPNTLTALVLITVPV